MNNKTKFSLPPLKDVKLPKEEKTDELIRRVETLEKQMMECKDKSAIIEIPSSAQIAQQLIPLIPGCDNKEIKEQITSLNKTLNEQNKELEELQRVLTILNDSHSDHEVMIDSLININKALISLLVIKAKSNPAIPKPKFEGRKKLRKYIGKWMLYLLKVLWHSQFLRQLLKLCAYLWAILSILAFCIVGGIKSCKEKEKEEVYSHIQRHVTSKDFEEEYRKAMENRN